MCFAVGEFQELGNENVDLPKPKSNWPKKLNLDKTKNFALSHNAQLRGEARNTDVAA